MQIHTVMRIIIFAILLAGGMAYAESVRIKTPLIHVIVSDQTQAIMLELNQLMHDRALTELQITELRVKHLNQLVDNIEQLVDAAEELTDAIPGVRMMEENRITFLALARQLQNEADNMKKMAEEYNYTGMEPAWQRMLNTCDACHRLFRF